MVIGSQFICQQWDSLADVVTPLTWELVVTGPTQTTVYGNLREGHNLPQLHTAKPDLQDSSTSFCVHPGMPEMSQTNRDAGWGVWAHQSSNYPACTNLLQKVAVCATPIQGPWDTSVVNNPVNLQTTRSILMKGAQDNLGHMQLNK